MSTLPDDAAARCEYPMADGLLYYFPSALAEVARVSKIGNDQHNPGEPMHWARGKSTDHANKIMRHLLDAGELDKDGTRHTAKLAWRALALLQEELEAAGAPMARNARTNSVRELFAAIDAMRASQGIRDAGEFTQPPNCSPGVSESKHPMHAVALEMAEAATPKRRSESAWSVTWPWDVPRPCEARAEGENLSAESLRVTVPEISVRISVSDVDAPTSPSKSDASQTEYQTLVGN